MSTPEQVAQAMAMMRSGGNGRPRLGRTPMALSQLTQYNPNRPDAVEAVWQPTYHFQSYGTAGATSFTFFSVPFGSAPAGYDDTNMQLASQFPSPQAFLVTAIMVCFFPGATASATSTTAVAQTNINDVIAIANTGRLEFNIGSKNYLRDAPVGKFAPNFTVNGFTALLGTTTAPNLIQTGFARAAGRYYEITPILIPQSQNFQVQLLYGTAQTVSTTGRVGVILDGFLYRQSQ